MQIDSSTLYLYVKELNKLLISSQIRQIHQIDQKIFDLELFRPNSSPLHLIINLHTPPIFYISSKNRHPQYIASQTFCMTLRKYLEGARISSIRQLDMDRLVAISADRIETAGEIITRTLYLELIPSTPNLILSENDILIDACSKGKKLNRRIIPGEKYTPPENSNRLNFMDFSETELINILTYSQNTAVSLKEWIFSSFNGFSRPLLDELLYRSGLTESTLTSSLSEEDIRKLACELISIISELKESDTLHVYRVNGKPLVSPILLTSLNGPHEDKDIVLWMESYMLESNSTIASTSQECRKLLNSLIKKETRKKEKISSELEETNLTETYKLWGNLLSIHSNEKVNGRKSLTVPNLFSDPVSDVDIPLDPQLSINQNSQIYFKKYAKMKTRFKIGMEKVSECEKRLEYLQELKYFLEEAKTMDDILSVQKELNIF